MKFAIYCFCDCESFRNMRSLLKMTTDPEKHIYILKHKLLTVESDLPEYARDLFSQ